ncbi:uncharacterized protein DMAD_00690 [Drosophila madeirensis]|uniref:Uncharacterized protein n=1 Tax=Drosophila madeirensis TaxID=30013 RepID=A0AAU9FYT3_DROMD
MKHNKAKYSPKTESNFKAAEQQQQQRATGHGEDRLEMTEINREQNEPLGHKAIHKQSESKDTSNGKKCLKVGALRNSSLSAMKAKEKSEHLQQKRMQKKSNSSTKQQQRVNNWYNTLQELRRISEEMRCLEEDEYSDMESLEPTKKPTLLAPVRQFFEQALPMPDGNQNLTNDQNLAENALKVEYDSTDCLLRLLELLWVQVAKFLDFLECAPVTVHLFFAIAMPLCLCGIALVFFG